MVSVMKIKPMSTLLISAFNNDLFSLCHLINLCYKRYVSRWENYSRILLGLTTVSKAVI